MLQSGDIALIKKVQGFRWLQESIAWWLNSEYSHCEPIIDSYGNSVDFTYPTNKASNIQKYFNGQWRVCIISPAVMLSQEQQEAFSDTIKGLVGTEYAPLDYLGFLINKPVHEQGQYHCGSGTLAGCQAAGLLKRHSGAYISPQSFQEYTTAGLFNVVWSSDRATQGDFRDLL